MNLSVGIVGLPNVGKSTLFNALLKKQVAFAANYPFATIEPNVGIVPVPDNRLPKLAEIVHTDTIVPATVKFIDIAGLVKGAASGEGLGNKFLAHIREVALIVHVVRLFEDNDVATPDSTDPESDIEIIHTELLLADLQTLEKQAEPRGKLNPIEEKARSERWAVVQKAKEAAQKGIQIRDASLASEDLEKIHDLFLLTSKPELYVFNVSENQLTRKETIWQKALDIVKQGKGIFLSAKMESDLLELDEAERVNYLQMVGLSQPALETLIGKAYHDLGLISFLTAGDKEARAWTIQKGSTAPVASGVIHTDFMAKFIKAEIVSFDDFVRFGGWASCREKGKVRLEGKEYVIEEGDIVDFKIGA